MSDFKAKMYGTKLVWAESLQHSPDPVAGGGGGFTATKAPQKPSLLFGADSC